MRNNEMSPDGRVNVSIANVVKWFTESENCLLHSHAQEIPITKTGNVDLVQSIIDSHFC
jgi:hypothetical protein